MIKYTQFILLKKSGSEHIKSLEKNLNTIKRQIEQIIDLTLVKSNLLELYEDKLLKLKEDKNDIIELLSREKANLSLSFSKVEIKN